MFKPNREFQAGLNAEETRRRRQNNSLSLRRKDRETKLQKKRQRILARNGNDNDNNIAQQAPQQQQAQQQQQYHKQNISDLPKLVHGCFSNNIAAQFECTRQFRMLLSQANNPPIREVIDSGVVPRFIQFCRNNNAPELQYESLWALLNIASGPAECTAHIIRNGSHNVFIDLLNSRLYEIREQALWALGNIAGDGSELKDLLLNNGILGNIFKICSSKFDEKYVTNFNKSTIISNKPIWQFINLLSTCSWTLSNLCRGSPPPQISHLYDLIKCLQFLLGQALSMSDEMNANLPMNNSGNKEEEIGKKNEIIQNIAWGFSYLTGFDTYNTELINKMGELGIISQFINLMSHKYGQLRHPINRLIGNILTGCDEHTRKCLDLGILSKYSYILSPQNGINISTREQREICWSLSNVCATDHDRDKIQVLQHGLFKILIQYLKEANYETAKEALWAISNATTKCNKQIILHLVEHDIAVALTSFLRKYEENFKKNKGKNKILLVALECIENILIVGDQNVCSGDYNKFSNIFEECGIVNFLEDLQVDEENINDQVYDKCVDIIKKYFHGEEDLANDNNSNNNTNDLNYGSFGCMQNNNNNSNNNNSNDAPNNNGNNFSFGINSNNNNSNNNNNNNGSFGF